MTDKNTGGGIDEYVASMRMADVERGILRVNQEIYVGSSILWMQEIDVIRRKMLDVNFEGKREVIVKITCPGGEAYHSIALYDELRALSRDGIATVGKVEGYAASAAATFILQACDYREAGPSSRILVHEIRGSVGYGRASDIEDEQSEMEALSDLMMNILEKRTGHDADWWHKKTKRREQWFSAHDALEYGLIDAIR